MKTKLFLIITILFVISSLSAQRKYYVGINTISLTTFVNNEYTGVFATMYSNAEMGLSINAGKFLTDNGAIEGRLSISKPNQNSFAPQIHFGYNSFILRHFNLSKLNFYAGGFAKYWDYYNTKTKVHFHSIVPYFTIGYMWTKKNNIFLDLRLNQTIYAISWSSLKHSKAGSEFFFSPMKEWTPILPMISFNIGYRF